ncbi:protein TMEPAI isoform X2 [Tribolium castaneum]|uniref:protein TMEPAI isoform X2 n=1 Tax=Tribolium castaneum TaxID=7070 RepID=UPI0030FEBEC3
MTVISQVVGCRDSSKATHRCSFGVVHLRQGLSNTQGSKGGDNSCVSDWGILVLVLSAIVLTVALGLITCVLSHYRPVTAGEGAADGGTAAHPHDAARTPTTAPMLSVVSAGAAAGVGGMDRLRGGRAARELAATRDRQVRLHAVHTDIAINLPPNIAMPDGEEQHPFTSSRLHIRDPEQESEIHQKCIRPPPNRTVLESESPPPYRSSSAGLLGSSSSSSSSGGGGEWSGGGGAPLVVRCHSMSSSSSSTATTKRPEAGSSGQKTDFLHRTVKIFTGGKKGAGATPTPPPVHTTLPVVIVPTRPRRTSTDHQQQQQQQQQGPRPKPSV